MRHEPEVLFSCKISTEPVLLDVGKTGYHDLDYVVKAER